MASSFQSIGDVFTDVRFQAAKDTNTLANSDLFRIANKYYLLMLRELIDLNEDITGQLSSTDLVANQREYVLPIDDTSGSTSQPYAGGAIKIQRVEVTYDGNNWYVASPISLGDFDLNPTILDSDVNNIYSKSAPIFWFRDRSIFLGPVPGTSDAVTAGNAGLRLYWVQRKGEMSATTNIPALPKDFLGILSEGILIDVFRKYGRITDMKIAEQNWNAGLAKVRELEQAPDTEERFQLKFAKKKYN